MAQATVVSPTNLLRNNVVSRALSAQVHWQPLFEVNRQCFFAVVEVIACLGYQMSFLGASEVQLEAYSTQEWQRNHGIMKHGVSCKENALE